MADLHPSSLARAPSDFRKAMMMRGVAPSGSKEKSPDGRTVRSLELEADSLGIAGLARRPPPRVLKDLVTLPLTRVTTEAMPVKRTFWTTKFTWLEAPEWPCPSCAGGTLKPKEKGVVWEETAESKKDHDENPNAWEPEWQRGRFAGLLVCQRCGEIVSATGKTIVSEALHAEEPGELEQFYIATELLPGPPLFTIPDQVPAEVCTELRKTWSLFWVDTAACANRIRSCIELVLTTQGIKRTTLNSKGKKQRLNLHTRIELYRQKNAALADAMMAVKWIGNAGSHAAESLSPEDLFGGLDLLEHVLIEVYEKRTKNLIRFGQDVIRRKGKPKKASSG